MAKIAIEFDTVDKTLACSVDGKALENVNSVNIYLPYGSRDDYSLEICQIDENDDEDYRQVHRTVAADTTAGRALASAGAKPSAHAGFVTKTEAFGDDGLADELLSFFKRD
jgi:hypothetical protein